MRQEIRNTVTKLGMAVILLLAACALMPAQEVSTNAMPGVDFSKYHTYKWVTIEGATYPNQIVDTQIKQAVDSQLAAKGLTKTDGEKADLLIGYQASVSTEKQWNAYGTGGFRWGGGDGLCSTVYHRHRHIGSRHVRSRYQTTRLDWPREQDARPQRGPGQEAKESR
jgi:hypothetical protein